MHLIGRVNILTAEDLGTGAKCKWPHRRQLEKTAACELDSRRSEKERNDLHFARVNLVINEKEEHTVIRTFMCVHS